MKNRFKNFLSALGLRLSRVSSESELNKFFNMIKPYTTNHELIRLGGDGDGGYLIPDDIREIAACYSPGVNEISNFEVDIGNRGIECFLADYSVEKPPIDHPKFHFIKKYIGLENDATYITLNKWLEITLHEVKKDYILQMDIEGAEYKIILDTPLDTIKSFRIMVIEFHNLDSLLDRAGFDLIYLTFKKLLKIYEIVHIHPNTYVEPIVYKNYSIPSAVEFTFLRKDRVSKKELTKKFPHFLDSPNDPNKIGYTLPKNWY